jgi:ABC-type antimicrobial peptide transport system ATPase subunit
MNAPLLEVENLSRQFVARRSAFGRPTAMVTAVEV